MKKMPSEKKVSFNDHRDSDELPTMSQLEQRQWDEKLSDLRSDISYMKSYLEDHEDRIDNSGYQTSAPHLDHGDLQLNLLTQAKRSKAPKGKSSANRTFKNKNRVVHKVSPREKQYQDMNKSDIIKLKDLLASAEKDDKTLQKIQNQIKDALNQSSLVISGANSLLNSPLRPPSTYERTVQRVLSEKSIIVPGSGVHSTVLHVPEPSRLIFDPAEDEAITLLERRYQSNHSPLKSSSKPSLALYNKMKDYESLDFIYQEMITDTSEELVTTVHECQKAEDIIHHLLVNSLHDTPNKRTGLHRPYSPLNISLDLPKLKDMDEILKPKLRIEVSPPKLYGTSTTSSFDTSSKTIQDSLANASPSRLNRSTSFLADFNELENPIFSLAKGDNYGSTAISYKDNSNTYQTPSKENKSNTGNKENDDSKPEGGPQVNVHTLSQEIDRLLELALNDEIRIPKGTLSSNQNSMANSNSNNNNNGTQPVSNSPTNSFFPPINNNNNNNNMNGNSFQSIAPVANPNFNNPNMNGMMNGNYPFNNNQQQQPPPWFNNNNNNNNNMNVANGQFPNNFNYGGGSPVGFMNNNNINGFNPNNYYPNNNMNMNNMNMNYMNPQFNQGWNNPNPNFNNFNPNNNMMIPQMGFNNSMNGFNQFPNNQFPPNFQNNNNNNINPAMMMTNMNPSNNGTNPDGNVNPPVMLSPSNNNSNNNNNENQKYGMPVNDNSTNSSSNNMSNLSGNQEMGSNQNNNSKINQIASEQQQNRRQSSVAPSSIVFPNTIDSMVEKQQDEDLLKDLVEVRRRMTVLEQNMSDSVKNSDNQSNRSASPTTNDDEKKPTTNDFVDPTALARDFSTRFVLKTLSSLTGMEKEEEEQAQQQHQQPKMENSRANKSIANNNTNRRMTSRVTTNQQEAESSPEITSVTTNVEPQTKKLLRRTIVDVNSAAKQAQEIQILEKVKSDLIAEAQLHHQPDPETELLQLKQQLLSNQDEEAPQQQHHQHHFHHQQQQQLQSGFSNMTNNPPNSNNNNNNNNNNHNNQMIHPNQNPNYYNQNNNNTHNLSPSPPPLMVPMNNAVPFSNVSMMPFGFVPNTAVVPNGFPPMNYAMFAPQAFHPGATTTTGPGVMNHPFGYPVVAGGPGMAPIQSFPAQPVMVAAPTVQTMTTEDSSWQQQQQQQNNNNNSSFSSPVSKNSSNSQTSNHFSFSQANTDNNNNNANTNIINTSPTVPKGPPPPSAAVNNNTNNAQPSPRRELSKKFSRESISVLHPIPEIISMVNPSPDRKASVMNNNNSK
jgi:hypothetical protein